MGARRPDEQPARRRQRATVNSASLFMHNSHIGARQSAALLARLNCDNLSAAAVTATDKRAQRASGNLLKGRAWAGRGDIETAPSLKWRRTRLKWPAGAACTLLATIGAALVLAAGPARQASALVIRVSVAQQRHPRAAVSFSLSSNSSAATDSPPSRPRRHTSESAADTSARRSANLLEVDALNYLQRYGYMNSTGSNGGNLISEDSFQEAIMQFQRFAGIPETGAVDSMTMKYMQMPRCGNKDLGGKGENGRRRRRRKKRYALQGSKWRRQELTYRISQYPTRFLHKKHEVDGQIEKAFRIWSQVAPIDFVVKREGRVHIEIRFASGEHGDGDPFDGPGNTLAHAYFPQYGGDAHFDDQEYWTVDSYAGTNIFQVAAHELGHSLGLGHSSVREALMAPFYQKYKPNFKLHADDVLGIQALYGERDADGDTPNSDTSTTSPSSTSTTSTTESSAPRRGRPPPSPSDEPDDGGGGFFNFGGGGGKPVDLCQDPKIDTITRTEDGNTYVFRGQYYWQIKNDGLAPGFPAKISRDWDGLPGNLDAALTWSDGKTFFFKGDKYWRFFNKRREPGYPKQISVGFAGIPNNLDAAFVWSGNGKTYFFKRDKYWRFDSKQEPPVSGQYPKPIKNWSGLPASGLDGAFKWDNGMTYFFKDDLYYRFDDREFEVDTQARPQFPRSTAEWWFGCTSSNLPVRRRPGARDHADAADESTDTSNETPSVLLFHRKPTLSYELAPPLKPSSAPATTSLSRSIISGLSALLPSSLTGLDSSSSSSSSSASSGAGPSDDWSFHRGVGEEVRRQVRPGGGAREQKARGADDSTRRWSFPLTGSASSGEQSLSELRLAPAQTDAAEHVDGAKSEAEELRSAPGARRRELEPARRSQLLPVGNATRPG